MIEEQMNEIERLRADHERLTAWIDDLQSGMYVNCVYCGHRYGPSETTPVSMSDALKAHVEQCPQHPMSALRAELAALRAELEVFREREAATAQGVRWLENESKRIERRAERAEAERDAAIREVGKWSRIAGLVEAERDRLLNWAKTGPHQMGCASLQDEVPRDQYGSLDLCNCGKSVALGYNKSTS